jgi:hypothetical protein
MSSNMFMRAIDKYVGRKEKTFMQYTIESCSFFVTAIFLEPIKLIFKFIFYKN